SHRGPDAQGIYLQEEVCLGHRRLSIIDVDTSSDQPFVDPKGRYVLVYNGEIYNFRELKAQLVNWEFRTHSDTEVLMAAYDQWGLECLSLFNGMFAFALWDREEKKLIIARDRLGIKPLYFALKGKSLIFASELRAILATGLIKPKLDRFSLSDFVQYQTVHDQRTILSGMEMLPPAHVLILHDNEQTLKSYWRPEPLSLRIPSSREEVVKALRTKLESAVALRLVADVPFGAFLSGGIDSSAIVALMSKHSDTQVNTFSVTFDEGEYSESRYAQQVAHLYHTAHTEIRLSPEDFLDNLPKALDHMDHPSGDGPNSFIVSKVTKEAGVTMALSGLGGDELFTGYGLFQQTSSLLDKKWIEIYPMFLRRLLANVLKMVKKDAPGEKMASILTLQWMDLLHIYPEMRKVLPDHIIEDLLNLSRGMERFSMPRQMRNWQGDWKSWPRMSQISWAEMNTYMRDVLLRDTDQMSMAHGLEVRVPFLDHRLVEFVLALPDEYKQGTSTKALLVDAMGKDLPREIVYRPKMGFTLPWEYWMKGPLKAFCEQHITALGQRGILNERVLQDIWKGFIKGDKRYTYSRLWHFVVLEYWMTKNHVSS
ncbi:MAG: asparagine synthase (glutamine-hydrolyzing), partial [Bacteroidetes bacterium]|nr:asparagine synthase (glutamine-hydrolyzing) [Bacteroidota bacterium]